MAQITKPITAELIEFHCEKCGQGVYRVQPGSPRPTNPKQWVHKCSACGDEACFSVVYPLIKYKERIFMLADKLRFERKD